MQTFQRFVLIVAIIILILLLLFIGFTLYKARKEIWPPLIGDCPDYWIDISGNGSQWHLPSNRKSKTFNNGFYTKCLYRRK